MKNNFVNVKNPLKSILEKYNLEEPYFENEIIKNWSNIVERTLSDVIKPVSLNGQKLVIKILNETWRKELEIQKINLLNKINSKLINYVINEIQYI